MTPEAEDNQSLDGNSTQSDALPEDDETPRRPPLQFSIRGILLLTAAVALLFGTMRWLGVSPAASALVLVVLIVAGLAAVGLLVAILRE
jgi:hypothetical protein